MSNKILLTYWYIHIVFGGTGVLTQAFARQVLYCLSHTSSPSFDLLSYNKNKVIYSYASDLWNTCYVDLVFFDNSK
jgi:hypothetical protein